MTTQQPLVSIIIPVYNSEKYVGETLQSCLDQTYSDIEIIVVNDGSSDGSGKVVQSFKDSRIRFYEIPNSGSCEARNFGISQAKGQLLQFLDHDDLLAADKIEHQVEEYLKLGDGWLYSGRMGSVLDGVCSLDEGYDIYEKDFSPVSYYQTVLNQYSRYVTTGAWLVPRKLVDSTHGWDAKAGLNDDGEYFMRIILNSKGIKFCSGASFYFRRDVPGSLSKRKDTHEVFSKWLYSYQSYARHFSKVLEPELARELSWKALSVFYCDAYPEVPDLRKICRSEFQTLGYAQAHPHGGDTFVKWANCVGTDMALFLWRIRNRFRSR